MLIFVSHHCLVLVWKIDTLAAFDGGNAKEGHNFVCTLHFSGIKSLASPLFALALEAPLYFFTEVYNLTVDQMGPFCDTFGCEELPGHLSEDVCSRRYHNNYSDGAR